MFNVYKSRAYYYCSFFGVDGGSGRVRDEYRFACDFGGAAFGALRQTGEVPRGVMYWNVADEGATVPGTEPPRELWMTRELAAALVAPNSTDGVRTIGAIAERGPAL